MTHGKRALFADYHGCLTGSGRAVADLLNEMAQAKRDIPGRMKEEKAMLPETAGQLLASPVFNPEAPK